jgi:hypothetical protein
LPRWSKAIGVKELDRPSDPHLPGGEQVGIEGMLAWLIERGR